MAPTAAMLFLLHYNAKSHTPPPPSSSPSASTFKRFKDSALTWLLNCNLIPKAVSDNTTFDQALQLCTC
ncbi:hypothetical protein HN51_013100 [Arachis hypogaea]|nr:uncharacterized protein DS421_3g93200 [Arachis hypogaea]